MMNNVRSLYCTPHFVFIGSILFQNEYNTKHLNFQLLLGKIVFCPLNYIIV